MKTPITDITEVQNILFRIAQEFHNIMSRNSIPYYMIGGTMLGAIRHKGFIPWDDDMDFGVPRWHYEQAKKALKKELPSLYRISTSEEGRVLNDYIKIEDTSTVIKEKDSDIAFGINIDIFPLDYCNNGWSCFSRNRWIKFFMRMNVLQYRHGTTTLKKIQEKIARLFPKNTFLNLAHKISFRNGKYLINYSGTYKRKEIIAKDVFGTPCLYSFNGTSFYGVEKYDECLRHLYGDYMTLPPESQRHTHLVECYHYSPSE